MYYLRLSYASESNESSTRPTRLTRLMTIILPKQLQPKNERTKCSHVHWQISSTAKKLFNANCTGTCNIPYWRMIPMSTGREVQLRKAFGHQTFCRLTCETPWPTGNMYSP